MLGNLLPRHIRQQIETFYIRERAWKQTATCNPSLMGKGS
ncbi:hypothetical protein HNP71_000990 [Acidocella aromatica]|uniref:Transposase n=1 Tax=Acidocella aromatica TaxID=1303579 RepID=A0A840VKH3_9PROT|nr:hypothetical protein [Acidocella aromatica]